MQCGGPRFHSWVRKIPWRRDRTPTPVFLGFPCGSAGKVSACNMGNLGLIPELGRSPGEGNSYPVLAWIIQVGHKELYRTERLSLHLYGRHRVATFHVWPYIALSITLRNGYYFHFTHEENKAQTDYTLEK